MAGTKQPHLAVWQTVRADFATRIANAVQVRDRQHRQLLAQLDARSKGTASSVQAVEAAVSGLDAAFRRRWHGKQIKRVGGGKSVIDMHATPLDAEYRQPGTSHSDPTTEIGAFIATLGNTSMPFTASSKAMKYDAERTKTTELITTARNHQASLARDLADALVALAPRAHTALGQRNGAKNATDALKLPPGIGDSVSANLLKVRPGHGPLVVQCGWLHSGSGAVQVPAPESRMWMSGLETLAAELTAPDIWVPALVDLDKDGGISTNSRATVNSLLLRLLALLPAGQMKLQVFDPVRLGESVKYLFQLGDSADKIIGDKVGSTTKELRELLEATERHITYVTQKYLGATHKSLHEYNLAAGEVAEPYQVLVLFDHPGGFNRPGSGLDAELVSQLHKIMRAGPRCGVYTVVHADDGGQPYLTGLPTSAGTTTFGAWPHLMAPILSNVESRPPASFTTALDMASQIGGGLTAVAGATSQFTWVPSNGHPEAPAAIRSLMTRIERDLHSAAGVEVSPERVGELAAQERADRRKRGLPTGPTVALTNDTSTWWKGDSTAGVVARIGRQGSSSITEVRIDSTVEHAHLLVGGKPGSGKSVFLHALIGDLTRTYPPTELELYLLDIKFGVEFKAYVSSPHARVVALESGREFGVSVLTALDEKMEARSKKFKPAGVSKIDDYRPLHPKPMPRIVAIIDEFHGLFEADDAVGTEAARLLRKLVKFGRAFGVHVVLASQTVSGAPLMPKDALGLIPQRVVFSSSPDDSRLLLAEDNVEGSLLNRPGEGIINLAGGRLDANTRFQGTLVDRTAAERQTRALATHARSAGLKLAPMVFDGLAECPVTAAVARMVTAPSANLQLDLPIGMPMGLGGAVSVTFRRTGGGNLLVVAAPARIAVVVTMAAGLALSGEVEVEIYDFHGAGSALESSLLPLFTAAGARARQGTVVALTAPKGKQIASGIEAAAQVVAQRHAAGNHSGRAKVLVLCGLEVASELQNGSPAADALTAVLEEGPAVGVHVIVCVERMASAERKLGYNGLDHFDLRVVGPTSRDESNRLIDDATAVDLAAEQLALRDRALPRPQVVRAFAKPDPSIWRN